MHNDRILVTGGAGFIGSHTVDTLVENGYEVIVLDNLSTGKLDNIKSYVDNRDIKFIKGDIRNHNIVKKAIQGCIAVIHLAAIGSVPQSIKDPLIVNSVNVNGTLNVLNSAISSKISKFIFASSAAVYGDAEPPHREELRLMALSPYAATKIAGEYLCESFQTSYELPVWILRYFNVYGPRMKSDTYGSVIISFGKKIAANRQPIINGDGKQIRDFIHVMDVVKATLLALKSQNVTGDVYNVGTGKPTSIISLCSILMEILGRKIKPKYVSARPGEVKESYPDISLIRKKLGFNTSISLRKGLKMLLTES